MYLSYTSRLFPALDFTWGIFLSLVRLRSRLLLLNEWPIWAVCPRCLFVKTALDLHFSATVSAPIAISRVAATYSQINETCVFRADYASGLSLTPELAS